MQVEKKLFWGTNALNSAAINLYPVAVFLPHQNKDIWHILMKL